MLGYVEGQGASGQVFIVQPVSDAVQQGIMARFCADRGQEYDEFREQCQAFLAEIAKETGREKFTYAELEENEHDLQKLTGWLPKIQARDFFGCDRAEAALADLEGCRQALETFASQVYAHEEIAAEDESSDCEAEDL